MLEFKNVTISYGAVTAEDSAVYSISLRLREGEVLGIAGESGCGKSTIAKAVLDILPPYASVTGEILYAGRDILTMPRRERDALRGREISMIFQDPSAALNPIRKIRRQFYDILHGSETGRAAMNARIERELEAVHLPEPGRIMEQYPPQLSGGMRQRVVIAAAMANRPRLLIADEPTSALDASVRVRIIDELMRIKDENKLSMLYISHDLAELGRICDTIMVMKDGAVVEYGETGQILNAPKQDYTRRLIAAAYGGRI